MKRSGPEDGEDEGRAGASWLRVTGVLGGMKACTGSWISVRNIGGREG